MKMSEPIPANTPIPIILARDSAAAMSASISRPAIAIFPDYGSTWNDFTYHLSANLLVLLPQQSRTIDIRFLVSGVLRTETFFTRVLGSQPWISIDQINEPFCSILGEAEAYGEVVQLLGFEGR
jgi:hypothetical protein